MAEAGLSPVNDAKGGAVTGNANARVPWLMEGRFCTPQNAARRLGVTDATVRTWVKAGVFRCVVYGKQPKYLLCEDDVEELVKLLEGVAKPTIDLVRVVGGGRQD